MIRVLSFLTAGVALSAAPALAAGPDLGAVQQSATNWPAIGMFLFFVLFTLGITYRAAKGSKSAADFYAAGGGISAGTNSLAIAGDYMSAASFLGISGLVYSSGFDGLIYSTGFLVGWPIVLFLIAERLRNLGKFTFADVASFRLDQTSIRIISATGTLVVVAFYLIAQMVGAGKLIQLLFGLPYLYAVVLVGALMIIYVAFGGMKATTWVQVIKACLLLGGASFMAGAVLYQYGFSPEKLFATAVQTHPKGDAIMAPGGLVSNPIDSISLGVGLMFGTAGLPHILVRFYTVPDAKTARVSVVWAMTLIGVFYIMTTFLGFGAATIVGRDKIAASGGVNMSAPLLAQALGGDIFFAFISAIAFATILAVVAGLTISASASFAHDFWTNVIHRGAERRPGEEVLVARITAFVVGAVAILIAILLGPSANVAFLVGLAFAVAASANLPVIVLSLYWKRFNTTGAVMGLGTGLVSSIALILISPSIMGVDTAGSSIHHLIQSQPLFPLENPGIISIPLGFLGAFLGSLFRREPEAERRFAELSVRAHTGLGSEKATQH